MVKIKINIKNPKDDQEQAKKILPNQDEIKQVPKTGKKILFKINLKNDQGMSSPKDKDLSQKLAKQKLIQVVPYEEDEDEKDNDETLHEKDKTLKPIAKIQSKIKINIKNNKEVKTG